MSNQPEVSNSSNSNLSIENFLFVFTPVKPDTKCLCDISLKIGVRIISILVILGSYALFMEALYQNDWFDLIWDIIATITLLVIGVYTFISTINLKYDYAMVGNVTFSILFMIKLLKCLIEGALMLLSFINPFGEDFFHVKTVLYLLGEGIGLVIDLYFIWVVYCFMISLKNKE